MATIKNILYICAGNTCRSPAALYLSRLLKKTTFKEELKDVKFDSAGIYHYYKTAQPGTVNYLKLKGVDISGFKTKRLDEDLLEKSDLVLGFEQKHHINKVKRKFKNVRNLEGKLFLLLDFAGETENLEIFDPFSLEQEKYNLVLKRIEEAIIKVLKKVIKINKS
jgi:protein-tyrosine-phosphatase